MLDAATIAQRLLGTSPLRAEQVSGGGNNRIFRVDFPSGPVALKSYRVADGDSRDRLGQEWDGLSLISRHLPGVVPRPLAVDRAAGWAAYEWVDGEKIKARTAADIDAATVFLRRLQDLRADPAATGLAMASEACLSFGELSLQVERRLNRLTGIDALAPLLERICTTFDALKGQGPVLPPEHRVLSPSDFGFHNALRRPDGRLVFLDFEYFGWDDPAKLASDIYWHPGMALDIDERQRFSDGLERIFGEAPDYRQRLATYRPMIGLRWCLILLNEFLPGGLARRRHAGQADDIEAARRRQLAKAHALYSEVLQGL